MIKTGNRHTAKGMILELWTVAQKYWLISRGQGIPKPAWIENGLPQELLDCRLARDDGDFIYAIGSKEQFAWLVACSENGKEGGPAAAKARVENKGKSKRRNTSRIVETRQDTTSSSPSSSSSSSSSFSRSNSSSERKKSSEGVAPHSAGPSIPTWEAYREAYARRYGEPPVRNAAVNGKLNQFVKRIGATEAPDVAAFYLTHNDQFYLKSMHPVSLLLRDAEKLRTEWVTGNRMLSSKAREIERMQHNSNSWDDAARILNERRQQNEAV